jgi:hypothetical protein
MVKSSKSQMGSITQPLIKELVDRQKSGFKKLMTDQVPSVGSKPLAQPDLYQDPGDGYNADFVFPQD